MKLPSPPLPAYPVYSLFFLAVVACGQAPEAAAQADVSAASGAPTVALAPPPLGHVVYSCTPNVPASFASVVLDIAPSEGAITYVVNAPQGSVLADLGRPLAGAATQTSPIGDLPPPAHAVTFKVFDGPPRTRTDGIRFIDIDATGRFVRDGSFRTPAAALEDGTVHVSLVEDTFGVRLEAFSALGETFDTELEDGVIPCTLASEAPSASP
jgi:hypothetical protein